MFTSCIVKHGCLFVRRMIKLGKQIKHLHYRIKRIEFHHDVDQWLQYLPTWKVLSVPINVGICGPTKYSLFHFRCLVFKGTIMYSLMAVIQPWLDSVKESGSLRDTVRIGKNSLICSSNWCELYAVVTAAATYGSQCHRQTHHLPLQQ